MKANQPHQRITGNTHPPIPTFELDLRPGCLHVVLTELTTVQGYRNCLETAPWGGVVILHFVQIWQVLEFVCLMQG
jgi:hypothetical protein